MSDEKPMGQVIQIDEARIRDHLGEMVRGTVEETLDAMLDAEADQLCGAGRYERSEARQDTRAGSYDRTLQTSAGEVNLKIPKLRRQTFETAIIERYRRREPGMIRIPEGSAPNFKNRSWTIAAEVSVPQGGASGVLATIGGRYGGWALLVQDSKPLFAYAYSNQPEHKFRVSSDQRLAPGDHIVRVKFAYDGGGIGKGATATLLVDEKQVAEGRIPQTIGVRFSLDETFDIGQDTGTPVLEEYEGKMPFSFTGTLTKFVAVLEPLKLSEDEQRRLHEELAKAMEAVQ